MTRNLKKEINELYTALNSVRAEKRSLAARMDNAKRASILGVDLGDNEFYYRVSMDFRGRLYYRGSHMNPQMGDDIKVMLTLGQKKPLTEMGFKWLLWGIASAAGQSKKSFTERVEWTLENWHNVREAVRNPIESQWFADVVMGEDEPALFLQRATVAVEAVESGAPFDYPTDITIAMDATCSGLQILSAVARDLEGGRLVNLLDTGERQDVYLTVLNMVKQSYANDTDVFAIHMRENSETFGRRFTKKVVMTLPYSATFRSAVGYILDELQGNMEKNNPPFPLPESVEDRLALYNAILARKGKDLVIDPTLAKLDDFSMYRAMADYLGRLVMDACDKCLPAALNLLHFFQSCPKHLDGHAHWMTPDGFRVDQVYGSREREKIQFRLQVADQETGELVSQKIQRRYEWLDPNEKDGRKASNGMPPNWVHSLDATLVRMVVRACDFSIVCIHDSFASHPADCEDLSKALREQFTILVQQMPLENLIAQLNEQIGEQIFSTTNLTVNTWDPEQAKSSPFLFC